ncbi:MAG TPA: CARDB domain-containing protein [Gaiellaceae bacterium]
MPARPLGRALAASAVLALALSLQATAARRAHHRARPDLIEASVTDPPASASPGDSFTATDVVRNRGRGKAGASTTRYYLVRGQTRLAAGSRPVPALRAGRANKGQASPSVPRQALLGTYSLVACADADNAVKESIETNNCRTAATKLVVLKAPPPPPPPRPGA